ncbi:Flp family type IVb pilin [Crenobacter sp. SG2303]|uniref:Flp family type IVb pilin n=1 Tax=Crenobacter oryzisoli TaxID=3056844 RepID=A0ABT7XTJ4_9NEIS|nr:Flp family type IVb pilin [Crenobacter sp. SG2303]MDN0077116.1 Flp family type IVb pilin [Crenobacter sp. SG2303]
MKEMLKQFVRDERGVSAIEYGLIAGLIAAGLVGVLTTLGGDIKDLFSSIATALPTTTK